MSVPMPSLRLALLACLLAATLAGCTTWTAAAGEGDEVVVRASYIVGGKVVESDVRRVVAGDDPANPTLAQELLGKQRGDEVRMDVLVLRRLIVFGPHDLEREEPRSLLTQFLRGSEPRVGANITGSLFDYQIIEVGEQTVRLRAKLQDGQALHTPELGGDAIVRIQDGKWTARPQLEAGARITARGDPYQHPFLLAPGEYIVLGVEQDHARFLQLDNRQMGCGDGGPAVITPGFPMAEAGRPATVRAVACNFAGDVTWEWRAVRPQDARFQSDGGTLAFTPAASDEVGQYRFQAVARSGEQLAALEVPVLVGRSGESIEQAQVRYEVVRVEVGDDAPSRVREGAGRVRNGTTPTPDDGHRH
ncbi:MAG TPA: hypothetical protein VFH47_04305 [Candidatus Thermoplasmatota archaeon]|nr:hypothetical protein [Candidatus Thermoplasmatota archaeon]